MNRSPEIIGGMLAKSDPLREHREVMRLLSEGKIDEARALIAEMHERAHEATVERVRQLLPDGG